MAVMDLNTGQVRLLFLYWKNLIWALYIILCRYHFKGKGIAVMSLVLWPFGVRNCSLAAMTAQYAFGTRGPGD